MRSFIRHPTDMPIEVLDGNQSSSEQTMRNIGHGGLSFRYPRRLPVGVTMRVRIAVTKPVFEADCRVAWCLPENDGYQVGVEFLDQQDLYRMRMVEQVCQIEGYRRDLQAKQGRALSTQEAALEWISRFAKSFPGFNT
jgi:hypothetical protein